MSGHEDDPDRTPPQGIPMRPPAPGAGPTPPFGDRPPQGRPANGQFLSASATEPDVVGGTDLGGPSPLGTWSVAPAVIGGADALPSPIPEPAAPPRPAAPPPPAPKTQEGGGGEKKRSLWDRLKRRDP